MTRAYWEQKMRVLAEMERLGVKVSHSQISEMYNLAFDALKQELVVKLFGPAPELPEPDFSLDEIEQARKVIEDLQ